LGVVLAVRHLPTPVQALLWRELAGGALSRASVWASS